MSELLTTDMSGIWDKSDEGTQLGTIVVKIPRIGTYVTYLGKSYEILKCATYQEIDPNSDNSGLFLTNVVFTTFVTLLPINDEGDETGEPTIEVKSDKVRLI